MIISAKRSYVFVHIPKTGGTSLALALEDRAAADDILVGDTPKARKRRARQIALKAPGRLWKHSTLRDVAGLYPEGAFIFTLVRNPWDRMVSYYHWLQDQSFDHPAVRVAKATTFAGFLRDTSVQESVRRHSYATYVIDANGHDHCDLYARLEHPEDLEPLWKHLGFQLSVPHVNRSDRDVDWRIYYDAEGFDIVQEIAAQDIARFGYQTTL
ncbi:sulfotransferase family protein [Yoonia maricola]|uniref:Sulfotransferase family protein n=1 Tax=Yoonia maricola TaxID=420999 RepID=A0A2M8W214_9RHOB|nr:sulfotransferase family 2 domain-containing protein [Yoonia maricola]PJI84959.1 sulfotransferase family protein [Yoonia maricola]